MSGHRNEDPAGGATRRQTHFGFRQVAEEEKSGLVKAVFDSVAPRYDLANDLMSGGVHRLWKAALIDRLAPRPGMRLLDIGGGTGDLAGRFMAGGGKDVTVCDINASMLTQGRIRRRERDRRGHGEKDRRGPGEKDRSGEVKWLCGDAEALPVADGTMDACVTAFCLRNVTRLEAALGEVRRVLKPGGYFLCLEFSRVTLPLLDRLYDAYSFNILPAIAGAVTGDREAYVYLVESIRRFPNQETFAGLIGDAGLERVGFSNLSGGIAALHWGWRL